MSSTGEFIRYLVVRRDPLDLSTPVLLPVPLGDGSREIVPGWLHEYLTDPLLGVQADRNGRLPWEQVSTLVSTLELENTTVMDDSIRDVGTGLAYAGITCGTGPGHWAIDGDVIWALKSGRPITMVSGASLGTKIDMFAHTWTRSYPLATLASDEVLKELSERGEPIVSVRFTEDGLSLDELETVQRLASTIAKLVHAMPERARQRVRIRLDIPCEEHWLPVLEAARRELISPKVCLAWFDRVKAHSHLLEHHFITLLEQLLGPYFHQVRAYNELRPGGRYLYGSLQRGYVPTVEDILRAMARGSRIWRGVLNPDVQELVDPRFAGPISTVSRLVNMTGMVTLMNTDVESAIIAVDAPEPTAQTMACYEAYLPRIIATAVEIPRVVAVYPCSKFFGDLRGGPGSNTPSGDPGPWAVSDGLAREVCFDNGDRTAIGFLLAGCYAV